MTTYTCYYASPLGQLKLQCSDEHLQAVLFMKEEEQSQNDEHPFLKKYIKSREKDLKKQFTEPLTNLSVYQGKVLMKLINRQTGNNCYELIKEYKGGLQARFYQTVAFFVGSSLKQPYDWQGDVTDRQIEAIVREIDGVWYNNPHRPSVRQVIANTN